MKVDAKELRLGNLVMGCNGKIIEIDAYGFTALEDHSEPNCPTPVHITPEILQSCGFIKMESKPRFFKNRPKHVYKNGVAEIGSYWFDDAIPNIQWRLDDLSRPFLYLHQLQNLYFALIGTELVFSDVLKMVKTT